MTVLKCVMPWKAFFMDEHNGKIFILPCCANWVKKNYGALDSHASIEEIWNSEEAQEIRQLIIEERMDEICSSECPWLASNRFNENNLIIINGPKEFVENQKLNNEEIKQRSVFLKSKPMFMRIIPTLKCNLKCRMCFQDHTRQANLGEQFYCDLENYYKYLYEIWLQGGEVLFTNRELFRVVNDKFKKNENLHLSLTTNGTLLTTEEYELFKQIQINYVTISLNAATRETYRLITNKDYFEKVIKNIKKLNELSINHPIKNFSLYLSFVIIKSNYHELLDFVNLCNKLEVKFRLLPVFGNRNNENIFKNPDILAYVIKKLENAEKVTKNDSINEIKWIRDSLQRRETKL